MAKLRELERTAWLERALAATTDEEMLVALVSAWRAAPLVALCEVVDAASAKTARPIDTDQDAWLAAVKRQDPCELPALLASVQTGRLATSRVRAEALQSLPLDPRVAPALLRVSLRSQLHGRTMGPFWTLVFRCIHRQFHPGIADAINEYDEADWPDYVKLKSLRRRLAAASEETVDAPTRQLIDALRAKLALDAQAAAAKSVDDFAREIWAAPLDDGLREVFADWLIAHDDPRGELIMLQLTRKRRGLDAVSQKREAALLKAHARTWMGPLEPVVDKKVFRFEGGFLYACKLNPRAMTAALMTHPAWATVREYVLDTAWDGPCDAWLDHMIALGAKRK